VIIDDVLFISGQKFNTGNIKQVIPSDVTGSGEGEDSFLLSVTRGSRDEA
jgi:hypothetical protein